MRSSPQHDHESTTQPESACRWRRRAVLSGLGGVALGTGVAGTATAQDSVDVAIPRVSKIPRHRGGPIEAGDEIEIQVQVADNRDNLISRFISQMEVELEVYIERAPGTMVDFVGAADLSFRSGAEETFLYNTNRLYGPDEYYIYAVTEGGTARRTLTLE